MTTLSREETLGVFSIVRTKRRRFIWCAWWLSPPSTAPFRAPDAWNGGAKTEDEARHAAEIAAGGPLRLVESRWARAWIRVRAGLAPFPVRIPRSLDEAAPNVPSARDVLGVDGHATLDDIKAAFRRKALEHHPDHGGAPEAFIALKRAYDSLMRRNGRPLRRNRRK